MNNEIESIPWGKVIVDKVMTNGYTRARKLGYPPYMVWVVPTQAQADKLIKRYKMKLIKENDVINKSK